MSSREDLVAMGFAPDRVDWAIKETPPGADLQARLDHIFTHENQPVPSGNHSAVASAPLSFPSAYIAPGHPPPFQDFTASQQQQNAPSGPTYTPSSLAESVSRMSLHGPANTAFHSGPAILEDEAVERYRAFLSGQKGAIRSSVSNKSTAKETYLALMKFFNTESLQWRNKLQLTEEEAATITNSHFLSTPFASSSTGFIPATGPSHSGIGQGVPTDTRASGSGNNVTREEAPYDAIAVYDPTRKLIPASAPMAELLANLITSYVEDEPVEALRKKVGEIRPRMTDEISDMRWKALPITQNEQGQEALQRRSEQHYSRLGVLQSREDWDGATRLEEEYTRQENYIRQQENTRIYQQYCQTFLDPARDKIHAAFTELHPLYGQIQRILEEDNLELDVVRAVGALEETSDLMEQGMTELETMEDDRREREFEMQRQLITDDSSRPDPWGEANNLEKQKGVKDVEIKATRAIQKVDRRNAFFALVTRRMGQAIAGVDRDKEKLVAEIQRVMASIPATIPLDHEDARAKSGETAPSKIPLPSKALYNQINEAQSSLSSVDTMCDDMREVLMALQRKQTAERRARDMAQLEFDEMRSGRGDNWYFGAGTAMQESGEKEDEATERAFGQERSERRAVMASISEPISTFLTRYNDREMSVEQRLAVGMTASGTLGSSATSGTSAGSSNTAANIYQQQQQTQTASNPMWSQYASNPAVTHNIGFSSTQWGVGY